MNNYNSLVQYHERIYNKNERNKEVKEMYDILNLLFRKNILPNETVERVELEMDEKENIFIRIERDNRRGIMYDSSIEAYNLCMNTEKKEFNDEYIRDYNDNELAILYYRKEAYHRTLKEEYIVNLFSQIEGIINKHYNYTVRIIETSISEGKEFYIQLRYNDNTEVNRFTSIHELVEYLSIN